MKKHEHIFKSFFKDFEGLSGFSFHEDRLQCLSSGETSVMYYDAFFRGESNVMSVVRISVQNDGEIRWNACCVKAAEELHGLYSLYFSEDEEQYIA
ncbi:hypothetical protein RJP21_18770 [Paenibacillus sp. VCA1]|uniref:hypothetical protein n=1 Tax=Paenibacillus sp. VCA1 TaxID=3039148 RepID=UPI0028719E7D|nr:hypothetical protein [Paenibacillus sp. VCA1]MDR9855660.1 hypothetical protein [Paenibacillus sp. VCA1]